VVLFHGASEASSIQEEPENGRDYIDMASLIVDLFVRKD